MSCVILSLVVPWYFTFVVMVAGVDYMGRTVIVFIGRLLPASTYPAQMVRIFICIKFVHLPYLHTQSVLAGGGAETYFVCEIGIKLI